MHMGIPDVIQCNKRTNFIACVRIVRVFFWEEVLQAALTLCTATGTPCTFEEDTMEYLLKLMIYFVYVRIVYAV